MADIFLSYAREDETRVWNLASALESYGWSVFWDRRIPHGKPFRAHIQEQLDSARCIVVLWSNASIASSFVIDEAADGLNDGRLVPVLIEPVRQPLGFRGLHAADLTDWFGNESPHGEIERLIASIRAIAPPRAIVSPSVQAEKRVFISSTSSDLQRHRLAAEDVARDLRWEPIGAYSMGTESSVELIRELIAMSDFALVLQAWQRGWVPKPIYGGDGVSSINALELAAADEAGRPVLAFLANSDWPGQFRDKSEDDRAWTQRFRDTLARRNATFIAWESQSDLPLFRTLLRTALTEQAAL